MKKTLLLTFAVTLLMGSSCRKELPPRIDLLEIQLSGNISSSITKSIINEEHPDLSIYFLKKDQSPTGGFGGYGSPLPATLKSTNDILFETTQYYLPHPVNNKTALVGWYPRSTVTGSSTTINIDGQTDIMLTQEIEGSKDATFGSEGKIHNFSHKLTYISVTVSTSSESIRDLWGKVTNIQVYNTPKKCTITFPATVSFNTNGDLDLVKEGITYPITIPTSGSANAGYCIISPTIQTNAKLLVTTENGGTHTLQLTSGLDAGTKYGISIIFTATGIDAKATVEAWQNSSITVTI